MMSMKRSRTSRSRARVWINFSG